MTHLDPLLQIAKKIKDADVPFVLIGGMAAIAYGSHLTTRDIDIFVPLSPDLIQKLMDCLADIKPMWRFRTDKDFPFDDLEKFRNAKNVYLRTTIGVVDILGELPGVGTFEEINAKAVPITLFGVSLRVIDLDQLITAKTLAGRDKDREGVAILKAIKKRRDDQGLALF